MFAPVERELVFDIDLTDYDDVRTCGKEGHICNACWPLMAVAVEVGAYFIHCYRGYGHISLWPDTVVSVPLWDSLTSPWTQ